MSSYMEHIRGVRALLLACGVVAIASWGALSAAPAVAVQAKAPLIESIVPEGGIEEGIVVKINPEGLETVYAIVVCMTETSSLECKTHAPVQDSEGLLAAADEGVQVDMTLQQLQGDVQYAAIVGARNAVGSTSKEDWFNAPLPVPPLTPTPFTDEHSSEGLEEGPRAAARAQAEFLAEKKAKEEQERLALEAARRAAMPPVAASSAAPPHCVIPSLLGHTLSGARYLLEKAHCRLGHVYYPRSHRGRLLVARQNPARGVHLDSGALVAVRVARTARPGE
jgi:hypothetical protein